MSVIGQEKGIKHGTPAGYKQHLYRKVPACDPCLVAERTTNAQRAAARPTPRIRKPAVPKQRQPEPPPGTARATPMTREVALTYIPYRDEPGQMKDRRERIKAAAAMLRRGAEDVIEALGVPDDELVLARRFVRLIEQSGAA
ncbi:hypothetical protein [Acrocarpospora sp. B8E8]|uniref:hypothetical protein n=1 Tax=Acrocarpospora sp. B8E8 TaxID=3153572 RepID=UPI00325D0AFB